MNNLAEVFGNSRPFAITSITRITLDYLATGQVWGKWQERLLPYAQSHPAVIGLHYAVRTNYPFCTSA